MFILDPKFKVDTKEPNAYFAPVVTHPKDAEAVAREMGGCIPLSEDQMQVSPETLFVHVLGMSFY